MQTLRCRGGSTEKPHRYRYLSPGSKQTDEVRPAMDHTHVGLMKRTSVDYSLAAILVRSVTNSSAAVGWIPIVASNCALVAPQFIAIANP